MFRNGEGYPDPTAGRACANIDKMIRKVNADRQQATWQQADGSNKKREHHKIRRRKKDYRTNIGV